MNQAHYLLVFNHIPIIGPLIGLLVLLIGFIFSSVATKRIALGIFIFSAVFAIVAFITGEKAEDIVEKIPGVSEAMIDKHSHFALAFIWMIGGLGVLSMVTFVIDMFKPQLNRIFYIITFIIALSVMVMARYVGTSGGEIIHTEIRSGSTQNGLPVSNQDDDKD
jgi:ABC-type branched-subunit amino acid transport system permease subunit